MKKITQTVLMLCLFLSAAFGYAHGAARTGIPQKEKGEGIPIIVIGKTIYGGVNRSESIQASIDGHVLSVVFTENLGQVAIDISTAAGASVDYNSIHTPNDVYYGEFEVTD